MKLRIVSLAFTLLFAIATFAGNENESDKNADSKKADESTVITKIEGQVMDHTSGESIAGAEVRIENSSKKTYTDFDGNFKFEALEPGTYNLIISYISYDKSLLEDIELNSGEVQEIHVKLINTK